MRLYVAALGGYKPKEDRLGESMGVQVKAQYDGSISKRAKWASLASLVAAMLYADGAAAGRQFGAIAWSASNGRHGYSYNFPTSAEAEARALQECRNQGGDCVVVLSLNDGCGALAAGGRNGYGALGRDRDAAERRALEGCRRQEAECRLVRAFCTGEEEAAAKPAASPANHTAPPVGVAVEGSMPEQITDLMDQAVGDAGRAFDGLAAPHLIAGFIGLLIFFRLLRGIARIRARLRGLLEQAARTKPSPKAPDWIQDRHPSSPPAPLSGVSKPRTPASRKDPAPQRDLTLNPRPVVWDMNGARRRYREGQ